MGSYIPQEFYKYIYLVLCIILAIVFTKNYKWSEIYDNQDNGLRKTVILGLFFVIYFGTRPVFGSSMGDTAGYASKYELIQRGIYIYGDRIFRTSEFIWTFIMNTMAKADFSISQWFSVIAFIYVGFNIWGIKRIFPDHIYPAFLFYVIFFLFYSGGINGIRNADAYSIIFFAITLCTNPTIRNYLLMAILFYIGYHIHTSVIATIGAFLLARFLIKNTNVAIIIWFIAIVVSLVAGNYMANNFAAYIDDYRMDQYLNLEKSKDVFSYVGFRWDFLIFSALPIAIGWYVTVKRGITDRFYSTLLNTYILANAVWVVFIYAAFSNRFAMLSWCLYQYVLCYPLLKMELWPSVIQTQRTKMLLWIQLLFTYYMTI